MMTKNVEKHLLKDQQHIIEMVEQIENKNALRNLYFLTKSIFKKTVNCAENQNKFDEYDKTQHLLKNAVEENSGNVYNLSVQMIQLGVVQQAVARLIERLDDIVHKDWDKDHGMSYLSIHEIRDTVRLIDMGFHPLFKEMAKEVEAINIHSDELFNTVVKGDSEQSSNTTTQVEEVQSV